MLGLIPARAGKTKSKANRHAHHPAHPRACGENIISMQAFRQRAGSSPRVRGKHPLRGAAVEIMRLIPARAGKTLTEPGPNGVPAAHPRACGENVALSSQWPGRGGSSPRVRGKHVNAFQWWWWWRLIPARAGKTVLMTWFAQTPGAHPRACGENRYARQYTLANGGSSPRVRGKLARAGRQHRPGRLIPARAGKTRMRRAMPTTARAHPRACGENAIGTVA